MKDVALAGGRWILAGVLLAVVGVLLALPLGRRRGTRLYRWRLALWALALGLVAGGALSGCSPKSTQTNTGTAVPDDAVQPSGNDANVPPPGVKCYDRALPDPPPPPPTCYEPVAPDPVPPLTSDVAEDGGAGPAPAEDPGQVMCYATERVRDPDVKPQPGGDKDVKAAAGKDAGTAEEKDAKPGDGQKDAKPQEKKDVTPPSTPPTPSVPPAPESPPPMCYERSE